MNKILSFSGYDRIAPKVDVIVVGAGISGLTTAMRLQQRQPSLNIKILEATNAIGGQITSTQMGELGAKWLTEDQYHVYYLMQYFKIPIYKRVVIDKKLKRCWELDRGIFGSLAKFELNRYINELQLKMDSFKPGSYE